MSDSNTLAPEAGTADARPESVRDAANSLPDDVFGWDDDEGEQNGTDVARAEPERQERAQRARDDQGRFAAQGEPEGDPEPEEGQDEAEGEEGEAEQPEDGSEPAEQEAAEQAKPEGKDKKSPSFSIEIDGQHYSAEDVRRGFLRQDDYTRKTQGLAQERQQFQTAAEQKAQQLQTHEQELANVLNLAVSALQDTMPARPSMELLRSDPIAYHEQMAMHTEAVERLQGLVSHQQQAGQRQSVQQQKQAQEEQERQRTALVEAQNSLRQSMPALFTEQGRSEFLTRVEKHSPKLGLGRGDIDMIQDPRAFPVLDLAMKYLDLQDRKPAAVQRAQSAPPIRPAARPGAGTRAGQVKRDAEQRFRAEPTAKNLVASGALDRYFGDD